MDSGNIDPSLMGGAGMTPGDGSAGLSGSAMDSPQDDGMGPPDGLGGPTPKRRRVTRACDECRRKKIKCDGKQVCSTFLASNVDRSHARIVPYIRTVRTSTSEMD